MHYGLFVRRHVNNVVGSDTINWGSRQWHSIDRHMTSLDICSSSVGWRDANSFKGRKWHEVSVGGAVNPTSDFSKQLIQFSLGLDQQFSSFARDPIIFSSLSRDHHIFAGKVPTAVKVMEDRVERSGAEFVAVVLQFFDHAHPANGLFLSVVQDMQPYESSEEVFEQLGVVHCIDIRY